MLPALFTTLRIPASSHIISDQSGDALAAGLTVLFANQRLPAPLMFHVRTFMLPPAAGVQLDVLPQYQ